MRGRAVLWWLAMVPCAPSPAGAQQWNDARALALVRQATDRRAEQLADSGLVDYTARAHGYVTFLAQLGEGLREPPRVVKADELALEVYWRAPNLSKQRIVGRRDTTLLPTDIQYHRDHLGIIQNNFPAIIRLGDGDEVRDVPHPLSAEGLAEYDFALSDSLRITIPGRVIAVYEVKVRPRDDQQPRVIGAVYVDRDNGAVVRMALSFTRAAFKDRQLEDLFVVLENGLVGTRFWLPRRQEIEIRRSATWLDSPVRGIIRGRWEISGYELNTGIPRPTFLGQEIVQAPDASAHRDWSSPNILDSLPPDVRAVTAEEIRRVQAEARTLVREQALRRARGSALAARGVSDFVRFNRIEGLALGGGVAWRFGQGVSVSGRARYGFEDRVAKWSTELRWDHASASWLRVSAADDFRDVGEVPERSLLVNSLAAQEWGSDWTDPYRVRAVGVGAGTQAAGVIWSLDAAVERHAGLTVHASPAQGRFEAAVPAAATRQLRVTLAAERSTSLWPLGVEGRFRLHATRFEELQDIACAPATGACPVQGVRIAGEVEVLRPMGPMTLAARTVGGALLGVDLPRAQDLIYLGGPMSAPGYGHHSLVGSSSVSQRAELRIPVPFPSVALGRFGRSANAATLAPFANVVVLRGADTSRIVAPSSRVLATPSGTYPSVGAGLLLFFDLLRVDVARGLREGAGRWIFSIDASRAFWGIL